jgi:DNA-binding NarL/FixJ family response regulator
MIRIALADDHPVVLAGLQQLFAGEPDCRIVAACSGGLELLKFIEEGGEADVAVLDLRMRDLDGMAVLEALRSRPDRPAVLMLTGAADPWEESAAARLGARALVRKEDAPEKLLAAVRAVAAGLRQRPDPASPARQGSPLTAREIEIVRMVAAGLRNKQIAFECGITEGTVKLRLHQIYRKLSIDGRVALSAYARASRIA